MNVKRYDDVGYGVFDIGPDPDGEWVKYEDYASLEAKCAALAAENAALKSAFDKPDAWLSWNSIPPTFYEPDRGGEYLQVHEQAGEKNDDGSDSWPVYRNPETETPATDAFLAEVRAQDVDMFASKCKEESKCAHSSDYRDSWWVSGENADDFAAQLRQEAAQ